MANPVDLSGEIETAINGAVDRDRAPVLGYTDDEGLASLSFRGSIHVHGSEELALWSRSADGGLISAIPGRPQVSLLYYEPDGLGPKFLSFRGRARLAPEANDEVYARIGDLERSKDPEARGVAVIIDVDAVRGFGAKGPFSQQRN